MAVDSENSVIDVIPSPVADSTAPQPVLSAAVQRFRSCRWRRPAEDGEPECCSHRDVLPIAGAKGFDPEAWCPECAFYKLRRTPKKKSYSEAF